MLRLLLEHKVDVDAKFGHNVETALHGATRSGHEAIVQLPPEHKADVNAKARSNGEMALHSAAKSGHEAVRLLHSSNGDARRRASRPTAR